MLRKALQSYSFENTALSKVHNRNASIAEGLCGAYDQNIETAKATIGMIDTLLALIGMGQSQSQRSADRFATASTHLANIESICLEASIQLNYEIQRLGRLADEMGVQADQAVEPLIEMSNQNEQISRLVTENRQLLGKKGASAQVVTDLERWEGTCRVMSKQIDLAARQIEQVLRTHKT